MHYTEDNDNRSFTRKHTYQRIENVHDIFHILSSSELTGVVRMSWLKPPFPILFHQVMLSCSYCIGQGTIPTSPLVLVETFILPLYNYTYIQCRVIQCVTCICI